MRHTRHICHTDRESKKKKTSLANRISPETKPMQPAAKYQKLETEDVRCDRGFHFYKQFYNRQVEKTNYVTGESVDLIQALIPADSKCLKLFFGSSGGSGNSIYIGTEKVGIEYQFPEDDDDDWEQFDNALKTIMMLQILPLLESLDLDLLEINYNVEDEYLAEYFLLYFKDFTGNKIKYVSLATRGYAVCANWEILNSGFTEKLYLECPECNKYYKAYEVVVSEHDH